MPGGKQEIRRISEWLPEQASLAGSGALKSKNQRRRRGVSEPHGLGSSLDRLASFHERLHPAEDTHPAAAVSGCGFKIAGEALLANLNQRAGTDALWSAVLKAMNIAR